MGNYLTAAQVTGRIPSDITDQLTSDDGASTITARIEEVIDDAEGEADGYLANRYKVPIDTTTHPELADVLEGHVFEMARWRLYLRRPPVRQGFVDSMTRAVDWFKAIAKGEIPLPSTGVVPLVTQSRDPLSSLDTATENANPANFDTVL